MSNIKSHMVGVLESVIGCIAFAIGGVIYVCFDLIASLLVIILILLGICVYLGYERKFRVPFSELVSDSKFEFRNMVKNANKSVFIVGPNLNFLNTEKGMETLLFDKMENDGVDVRMLLSDPNNIEICEFMQEHHYTKNFIEQLNKAIENFRGWNVRAKKKTLNLKMHTTAIVPLSLLFIDVDDKCKDANAKVLVIPIARESEGPKRPCFLITKHHHYALRHYYDIYNKVFRENSNKLFDNHSEEIKI